MTALKILRQAITELQRTIKRLLKEGEFFEAAFLSRTVKTCNRCEPASSGPPGIKCKRSKQMKTNLTMEVPHRTEEEAVLIAETMEEVLKNGWNGTIPSILQTSAK